MNWHVYRVPPLDAGWDFLLTVAEALALAETSLDEGLSRDDWRAAFNDAQAAAEDAGWEGDFRGEPHILMLPLAGRLAPGFVWKQDKAGLCFVASPCALPWLEAAQG
ncbi:hypothetical protein [Bordetella hinzii]|jgi:hypothetical protein|uniref:Uncharacterized protein n=2 Tax=Bordetella hinzii TaxID=103855 RepID=A0AAN1VGW8_9BORD|nr:hypothetical protein [Bordetella hinzii]AKQ56478.1 hypothetical protein ACR54_03176 [Bordetella hinzii]AKQ60936.1 hypothetical protein ACR55_03084 [Bordetella hinzii]AZW18055.1 hypothetical protein CS347_15400 [Bordetella hinzii]KCB21622.1 hypothetical protein L544_2653 [Bordetella hinzii OH87 BAL007II]KCB30579.1 hypothetical protein L543_2259 [Bordetella hinzii L60]